MEKTIDDFTDCCHCEDPEWIEFRMKRENESLIEYVKRITPNSENATFTQFTVTHKRHTNFTLEPYKIEDILIR
jgi:hypothetical protein